MIFLYQVVFLGTLCLDLICSSFANCPCMLFGVVVGCWFQLLISLFVNFGVLNCLILCTRLIDVSSRMFFVRHLDRSFPFLALIDG